MKAQKPELPVLAVKIEAAAEMLSLDLFEVRQLINRGELRTTSRGTGLRVVVDSIESRLHPKSQPDPDPTKIPPSGVYLIRAGQYYKIGIASNVRARIRSMQTGSPVTLELIHFMPAPVKEMAQIECFLHRHFQSKNVRGEWYSLLDEDVQYICSMGVKPGVNTTPANERVCSSKS